jgi:hypothetical protein
MVAPAPLHVERELVGGAPRRDPRFKIARQG